MAKSRKFTVVAVSDGSSVGTFYTPYVSGYVESVQYIKDGTTPYTDGVDFTITADVTGEDIWVDTNINASEVVRPRAATCTTAGADAGTMAIHVQSANDIVTATAVSAVGDIWDEGQSPIIPKANTPESTAIKLTADRTVTATIATQAFTAGKFTVYLYYVA